MFSLFRRLRGSAAPAPEPPQEDRQFHHARVPDAADLTACLELEDGQPPIPGEVLDMSIQGARLRVPFHLAPDEDDVSFVRFCVEHARDGWRVATTARVIRVVPTGGPNVEIGLRFIDLGDLYSQLDDALGRYFNRRTSIRVHPPEEGVVPARLSFRHHRLRGSAFDLSATGAGIRLSLIQAAVLQTGEVVKLVIEVPGLPAPLAVEAEVRHGYRVGEEVVLGTQFLPESVAALGKLHGAYGAYLRDREARMVALQGQLLREG